MSKYNINGGTFANCRFGDTSSSSELKSALGSQEATGPVTPPMNSAVRRELEKILRTDSELNAFCIDFFPEVHQQFGQGMARNDKINLLLTLVDAQKVKARLRQR